MNQRSGMFPTSKITHQHDSEYQTYVLCNRIVLRAQGSPLRACLVLALDPLSVSVCIGTRGLGRSRRPSVFGRNHISQRKRDVLLLMKPYVVGSEGKGHAASARIA